MSESKWDDLQMAAKIEIILRDLRYETPNHFGQPFVSTYQIAIEFVNRYPAAAEALEKPLGGEGTGEYTSIAQYIAGQLSQRIQTREITNIEAAWLHEKYVGSFIFRHKREDVKATNPALSMFRLYE